MWNPLRGLRRRKLLKSPLSETQRQLLRKAVPPYRHFDPAQCKRFETAVRILVGERSWEGCEGLQITETMRYVIAGNASLMLMGVADYYFDSVNAILVFPDVIERTHEGVTTTAVGEAWDTGGVILSWSEVAESQRAGDGRNVVIHEFAHHLDGRDGEMGGSIPFPNRRDQQRWDEVSAQEFERLVDAVEHGKPTLLDPYGATDEAEFFAVASECFFEQPTEMKEEHPELFELLKRFYQLDPRRWQPA